MAEFLTKQEIESKVKRFIAEVKLAREQENKWNLKLQKAADIKSIKNGKKAIDMRIKWTKKKEKAKLQRDRFQFILRQLNNKQ